MINRARQRLDIAAGVFIDEEMTMDSYKREQLRRVGVRVVNRRTRKIKCVACGSTWFIRGYRLKRYEWVCRMGCNRHFRNIARPVQTQQTTRSYLHA